MSKKTEQPAAAKQPSAAEAFALEYPARLAEARRVLAELVQTHPPRLDAPADWDALQALRKALGLPVGQATQHDLDWRAKTLAAPVEQLAERQLANSLDDVIWRCERAAEAAARAGHAVAVHVGDERVSAAIRGVGHPDGREPATAVIARRMHESHPARAALLAIAARVSAQGSYHGDEVLILGRPKQQWYPLEAVEQQTAEWETSRVRFIEEKARKDKERHELEARLAMTSEEREIEALKARVSALEAEKQRAAEAGQG